MRWKIRPGSDAVTSHEPNRMLIRENKGFYSFAFDSAHVKNGVWTWPKNKRTELPLGKRTTKSNLIKFRNTDRGILKGSPIPEVLAPRTGLDFKEFHETTTATATGRSPVEQKNEWAVLWLCTCVIILGTFLCWNLKKNAFSRERAPGPLIFQIYRCPIYFCDTFDSDKPSKLR